MDAYLKNAIRQAYQWVEKLNSYVDGTEESATLTPLKAIIKPSGDKVIPIIQYIENRIKPQNINNAAVKKEDTEESKIIEFKKKV